MSRVESLLQGFAPRGIDFISCGNEDYFLYERLSPMIEKKFGRSLREKLSPIVRAHERLQGPFWRTLESSFSVGDSLWENLTNVHLRALLRTNLFWSLYFERGFAMAGAPRQDLTDLIAVWEAGVYPLGYRKTQRMVVLSKESTNDKRLAI